MFYKYNGNTRVEGKGAEQMEGNERLRVVLSGENGNVFNLIGVVRRALVRVGREEEADEMVKRAHSSDSYQEVLQLFREYVDIE